MLSLSQAIALDRSVSPTRLSTYLRVAQNDSAWARQLYLWDRQLAGAFLTDIAVVEIAVRNAMHERLSAQWGPSWFAHPDVLLDDRSCRQLATAWSQLTGRRTPDRVIAQCMLGFWVGLIDRGDHLGTEPRRVRCSYETQLWRGVLDRAFLGGRTQARRDGERWGRAYAHQVVYRVNLLRNRIAHHEPLINGYPMPGQQQRRTAEQGFEDLLRLAAMLDRHLHAFVLAHSRVPDLLDHRPRRRDSSRTVIAGASRVRGQRPLTPRWRGAA